MRRPRIKASKGEDALYHCISRIVSGSYIFGVKEKEFFVSLMWKIATFLEIEILDYVVMTNHYHQMVFVPGTIKLSDKELTERLRVYYGEKGEKYLRFKKALLTGGKEAEMERERHLRRMGNISEFNKTLKERFTAWYNKRKNREGTLWMGRFTSSLSEDTPSCREILAAYITLNPVRAKMVIDPLNYRHCAYGAAMGGDQRCKKGIMRIMGKDSWKEAAQSYRIYLMERGHTQIPGKSGFISRDLLLKTLKENGRLSQAELLRLRIRYFSDGLVLGSEAFVEQVFQQYRSHFGEKRKTGARPIRALPEADLCVMQDFRKAAFS